MSERYAIEIRLVQVDEAGKEVKELDVVKKPVVSDSLESMAASMDWLSECLGNAMYDHIQNDETLFDRETGEPLQGYMADEEEESE